MAETKLISGGEGQPIRKIPDGATHTDGRCWYRFGGRETWDGSRWVDCGWGDCDPLNHIRPAVLTNLQEANGRG